MYLEHFGLQEKPFSLTPDTQFFLSQKTHRYALNTLEMALQEGEGFIKIVGEVGTGKTMLCRILLSRLDKYQFVTAYIPNPWLTPQELNAFVASELGCESVENLQTHEVISIIYRRLMQLGRQKKQVVLVIDEAQAMPRDTIESLRLLTNLETEKRKLIQVVILGQPELDQLLKQKNLRQLNQRIVFSEYLEPLRFAEVRLYIDHRIRASGSDSQQVFSLLSKWILFKSSKGIPRLINILSHKAMLCAFGRGDTRVRAWHVAKAIGDTPESAFFGKLIGFMLRFNERLTSMSSARGA